MENKKQPDSSPNQNDQLQGTDKAPGEEKGRKEQVTTDDLKGKKVDADPGNEKDRPLDRETRNKPT